MGNLQHKKPRVGLQQNARLHSSVDRSNSKVLGLEGQGQETLSVTGSCFKYTNIVSALLPCMNSRSPTGIPTPYFFCSMEFNMTSPYLRVGSAGTRFSKSQLPVPQGPAISEIPVAGGAGATCTTPIGYSNQTTYAFVQGNTTDTVLIQVFTQSKLQGYLTFKPSGTGNAYVSAVVQFGDLNNGSHFGVLTQQDNMGQTSILLAYYDDTITPRLMAFMTASSPTASVDPMTKDTLSRSSQYCYHGLYVNDTFSSTVSYDSATLTITSPVISFGIGYQQLFLWNLYVDPATIDSNISETYMLMYCTGFNTQEFCQSGASGGCTSFTAATPLGATCRTMADIGGSQATDTVYRTTCGIDPDTGQPFAAGEIPPNFNKNVLGTLDCACINYSQSWIPQMGMTYQAFRDWATENALPAVGGTGAADATCWWPACTINQQAGSLMLSMTKNPPCPDVVNCISVIETIQDGIVTKEVSAACSQKSSGGGGGGGGGSGGNPSGGRTSTTTPFLKSTLFKFLLIAGVIVFLLLIGIFLFKTAATAPELVYITDNSDDQIMMGGGRFRRRHFNNAKTLRWKKPSFAKVKI